MINLGESKLYIAGMDGYSHDVEENYGEKVMTLLMRNALMDAMNTGMSEVLARYRKQIEIEFVTRSRYSL